MGWSRLTNTVEDGDPIRRQVVEKLADEIGRVLEGHTKLDRLLIRRHAGRGGWRSTDLGLAPGPDSDDLNPEAAAEELVGMIEEHQRAEGKAKYQVLCTGESARGTPKQLFKLAINLDSDVDVGESEVEASDLLKECRGMIETMTSAFGRFVGYWDQQQNRYVQALDLQRQQGETLVRVKELEFQARDRDAQRAADLEMAKVEAESTGRKIDGAVRVLGFAADGFMANLANRGGVKVERGDAAKHTIREVWATVSDEAKGKIREILGDEIVDLLGAAAKEDDAAKRRPILRELKRRFDEMSDEQKQEYTPKLVEIIDAPRIAAMMAAIRLGAA